MKKNHFRRFLALTVSAIGMFGLSCCEQGEIDDLREEMQHGDQVLEARIASLEEWQKSVNTDIQSLRVVLKGLESRDYVTGVTPLPDGSGYTISFKKIGSVTIRHGEKGGKGDAPVISVKPGSDGRYYWTIDGGFLTDKEGNKVPATGAPGKNGDTPYIGTNGNWWIGSKDTGVKAQGAQGEPGTSGKDGITPQLRVNADTDEWEVSVDNGVTWRSTGVAATGKQGGPGDSWFKGIDISRPDYVELTLADGTLLRLPRYAGMFVKFDGYEPFLCSKIPCELSLILPESLKENDYTALMATVVPADESTDIATRAFSGWGVKVIKPSFNEDGTLVPGSAKVRIVEFPEEDESKALLKVTLVDAEGREYSASRVVLGKPAVVPALGPALVETAFGMELELVLVDGGTFWMGAQPTDSHGRNYDFEAGSYETPVHQVTLSDDYYIGKYEVTQGQWEAVMGTTVYQQRNKENPSYSMRGVGDNYPMYYVNYYEAQEFVQKLNERTGKRYALPTEAQWEYAARGGNRASGTKYSGSNGVNGVAWYWYNIPSTNSGDPGFGTQPVGTKAPNELGLYDMSGNVWEWCADWYGDYSADSQTDPQGPSSGFYRVIRGGSWLYDAGDCRVSYRSTRTPDRSGDLSGFRLALLS